MSLNVSVSDFVALVEVNRPPANYFDIPTLIALADALSELDGDPACRAVVLASAGKHFCAGMDFASAEPGSDTSVGAAQFYRAGARIFDFGKPIIAAVQGTAVGGGLGLACAADFRVADPATRFVANFAKLGFHQGFGLSVTLPGIVGQQAALDMLLTGRRIDGVSAGQIGLADRVVDAGTAREAALAWAGEIAAAAPLAVVSIRATLRAGLADRVRTAMAHELAQQKLLWPTADSAEGIAASLERRTPTFTGH